MNSFDELMDSIVSIESKLEWDEFQVNNFKLIEINKFLLLQNNKNQFVDYLEKCLIVIDKKTQYYLKRINWEIVSDDIRIDSNLIYDLFCASLNTNNPFDKLKYLLDAYKIITKFC